MASSTGKVAAEGQMVAVFSIATQSILHGDWSLETGHLNGLVQSDLDQVPGSKIRSSPPVYQSTSLPVYQSVFHACALETGDRGPC